MVPVANVRKTINENVHENAAMKVPHEKNVSSSRVTHKSVQFFVVGEWQRFAVRLRTPEKTFRSYHNTPHAQFTAALCL